MANHTTKSITIYQKTYQLPVLEGDSFQQIQTQIKQRQQIIKQQKRTKKVLFGLYQTIQELSFEDKFQELARLITDYDELIAFLTEHKEVYLQFFAQLTNDLRDVVKEKLKEATKKEQKRLELIRSTTDKNLLDYYQSEKQRILSSVWLFGKAFLLMLKKIESISEGIKKITSDQDIQRQLLKQMLKQIQEYKNAYEFKKEVDDLVAVAEAMADTAVNFEQYLQPFIGSFQGLINQVCEQDNTLSGTVTEIQSLVEDIMSSKTGNFMSTKADDLSKNMLDFLITNEQKKERLIVAVEEAQRQGIDWSWQQIDVKDCGDLTKAITALQSHIDGRLGEYTQEVSIETVAQASSLSSATVKQASSLSSATVKQASSLWPSQKTTGRMPVPQIQLKTAKADFTQLDQYLKNGQWKEADEETANVMLKIMGREEERWLTEDNCKNFPREELKIIDSLWIKYSNGKFGFSVQKKIWLECGGKVGVYDFDIFCKFADKIGWRKGDNWLSYSELTFNTTAPQAHLPLGGGYGIESVILRGRYSLFSSLDYNIQET
jgi:hypothetical protein